MFRKSSLWYKLAALILVLVLVTPVLAACGGNDDEPSTPITTVPGTATPTTTATATSTTTTAPTPTTSSGPVKVGAIVAWSGPMAVSGGLADSGIKLVEWQVKQQGGILGGREFKVIRYDDKGNVADAAAGARKLYDDDNVSILVFGGSYGAEMQAVAVVAAEKQILFLSYGDYPEIMTNKFTAQCLIAGGVWGDYWLKLGKMLNAKTVAWLSTDQSDVRDRNQRTKGLMAAAGIETVYEEYVQAGVQDLSSYITKIKFEAPDILCADFTNEQYMTLGQQIAEQGGLGKTKLLAMTQAATAGTRTKGFEDQYVLVAWMPGMTSPEAVKYEQDFKTVNNRQPNPNHIYYYVVLWTAIHAIETAGSDTDRVKIAEVVRSGNLEFDTPIGHAHFTTDGHSGLGLTATQVQGGQLVTIDLPE